MTKPTLKEENKILDNALDFYEKTLKDLVEAINLNIETVTVRDAEQQVCVPAVRLQYIASELEEAKQLLKQ